MNRLSSINYIKEVAIKEGLSTDTVTSIVKSQFEFLIEVMDRGNRTTFEFETLMLADLGKFAATDGRIAKIKKASRPRQTKPKHGTFILTE
jgi:hypothetical protein